MIRNCFFVALLIPPFLPVEPTHKSEEGRSSYNLSYKVTVHINKEGCEYEEAKTVDVTLLECTCLQFVVASFQRSFLSWPLDHERNYMK